jgi:hypothetical protein
LFVVFTTSRSLLTEKGQFLWQGFMKDSYSASSLRSDPPSPFARPGSAARRPGSASPSAHSHRRPPSLQPPSAPLATTRMAAAHDVVGEAAGSFTRVIHSLKHEPAIPSSAVRAAWITDLSTKVGALQKIGAKLKTEAARGKPTNGLADPLERHGRAATESHAWTAQSSTASIGRVLTSSQQRLDALVDALARAERDGSEASARAATLERRLAKADAALRETAQRERLTRLELRRANEARMLAEAHQRAAESELEDLKRVHDDLRSRAAAVEGRLWASTAGQS